MRETAECAPGTTEALCTGSQDPTSDLTGSVLEYELVLSSGFKVWVAIYLVYAKALGPDEEEGDEFNEAVEEGSSKYSWKPVTRACCIKGCVGPILGTIQRYGKQGKVQGLNNAADSGGVQQDTRNLYISIDEASNHATGGPEECKCV